jgi:DNA-binding response OmpR family regulator
MDSTVLVVEDNPDLRMLVRLVLSQLSLDLHEAGTVADARAFLAQTKPSLVLLDVALPDGSGDEILGDIPSDVPIVLMTAYPAEGLEMWTRHRGVVKMLHKPFSFHELLGAVQETIGVV